ncbi:iron-sulfur-binding ferredoxin reductase [Pseudomonas mangrovi]|uniref:Iron-sulfur-binding ferredoxin reductase n=1 Tax=Pseudomonas mangrovi TaxID=2161748 RepID=A0A2T5PEM6_9PSED|nr:iron-sulfur-binding ferredoxin reductase [Pseudomonas mangrovi]PTU76178.1 iron-sulfur-binding ferredoxin reductase [Pseudomonas mangrovi]
MPELRLGDRSLVAESGSNLLDTLLAAGVALPYSCRAGSCHACMVRCQGALEDAQPDALSPAQREQGWRLACQCRLQGDLAVELFDPGRDGLPARVQSVDWLSERVLRLRLLPERPLRYAAGQHLLLWNAQGLARPYSLASLPGEDTWLEFHLDCLPGGAFSESARCLQPGDPLRLGELRGGALHYDPTWSERPLWLLAAGTGLAPLWGILREALRQHHQGPIKVIHLADDPVGHYLAQPLLALAAAHSQLNVQLPTAADQASVLAGLRLVSRQTLSLLCGSPASVDAFARRLFLIGVPRNQVLADVFLPRA